MRPRVDVPDERLERNDIVSDDSVGFSKAVKFERRRQRDAALVGGVAMAVTNDATEVLLLANDWMDG